MPWKARLNGEPVFVELTYSGMVTPQDLLEALAAAGKLAQEGRTQRFLADLTTMIGGHSIAHLYELITLLEANGVDRAMKEAIVSPNLDGNQEQMRFYETACLNRGYRVRLFRARGEALAWLFA
ncbi:MAG: STAS/SEC14 domain-containing protein [Spirochaetes bacterium]|nr:STAS/SEC14 domain-containing protein [Spirochaetota bacterium]